MGALIDRARDVILEVQRATGRRPSRLRIRPDELTTLADEVFPVLGRGKTRAEWRDSVRASADAGELYLWHIRLEVVRG